MAEVIRDYPSGNLSDEERRCWMNAALGTPQADTFCCTPAWQLAFRRAFTRTDECVLRGADGAFIAFEKQTLGDGGTYLTPLEYMWFSGCPVLGPDGPELFAESMPLFRKMADGAELRFIISGVDARRKILARLSRACGCSFRGGRLAESEQRSASLEGGLDGWLSRRSGNFRAKLRKAVRRGAAAGLKFERAAPEPGNCGELFSRMEAVERKSWKGMEGSGIVEAQSADFYREMLGLLAPAGEARLIFARLDGQDAGFIFGGMAGGVYRGQQFSYDAAHPELSIGDLLQFRQISDLCEEGALRYDLGMSNDPRMAYKTHWAESVRHSEAWIIIPDLAQPAQSSSRRP